MSFGSSSTGRRFRASHRNQSDLGSVQLRHGAPYRCRMSGMSVATGKDTKRIDLPSPSTQREPSSTNPGHPDLQHTSNTPVRFRRNTDNHKGFGKIVSLTRGWILPPKES